MISSTFLLIYGSVGIVFGFLIAYFLGRRRHIGFAWSMFFCVIFNPLFGGIITLASRKKTSPPPKPSKVKRVIGWIIFILFIIVTVQWCTYTYNPPPELESSTLNSIASMVFAIGMAGFGQYLIQVGKGKIY